MKNTAVQIHTEYYLLLYVRYLYLYLQYHVAAPDCRDLTTPYLRAPQYTIRLKFYPHLLQKGMSCKTYPSRCGVAFSNWVSPYVLA